MKGWHFCRADKRLGYNDGREIRVGEKLTVNGLLELCHHGLHASRKILDALQYAPDECCLCRVELSGTIVEGNDKAVATERTVEWMLDTETTKRVLRDFARRCALDVIHLWDAPDVVVDYLKTGDESLRAAAWDDAGDAARDAFWAAWDAAWAAARAAAWAAAGDAARAAAGDAAWDDAGDAAGDAAWAAAWDDAGDAAGDAAGDKQNRRLTSMVVAARKAA